MYCGLRTVLYPLPLFKSATRCFCQFAFPLEENEKILKILNKAETIKDFKDYTISKPSGTKLLQFRVQQGEFKSLKDPLSILSSKVLVKFYKSIVKDSPGSNPVSRNVEIKNAVFFDSPEARQEFNGALSIVTAGTTISWCLMECERTEKTSSANKSLESCRSELKLHLAKIGVEDISLKKSRAHFLSILTAVKRIVEKIPSCNLYILEELSNNVPSPHLYNFALQRTQLRSFIMGLLSARTGACLSSVKVAAVGKLFKLHVGTERVSGQYMVEGMMGNKEDGFSINESIRWEYLNGQPAIREHMANAILLNLGYWKLSEKPRQLIETESLQSDPS